MWENVEGKNADWIKLINIKCILHINAWKILQKNDFVVGVGSFPFPDAVVLQGAEAVKSLNIIKIE